MDEGIEHRAENESVPPPLPSSRGGKRFGCCVMAILIFPGLCLIAALGSYLMRRSAVSVPGTDLPWTQPTQPPFPPTPTPTPHILPDTVDGVTRKLESVMKKRFGALCGQKGIEWPPQRIRLVGLKAEKQLELWAANIDGQFQRLKTYPMLAASGDLGPKRRQGDRQVPEGHYKLVYLNADSDFHLSMLLNYPNAADKARESEGLADGADLGGDICVHGSNQSVGCIAVGDAAIEEIFTLAALARVGSRDILVFPADFRKRPDLISLAGDDVEVLALYQDLAKLAETVTVEGGNKRF